jgi:GNAT superfamily N-acetyltransferase
MAVQDLLIHVEGHARALAARSCDRADEGPFAAFFHRGDPALSFAAPVAALDDAATVRGHVAALRRRFAERGHPLRFEFALLSWPHLPATLQAAGLVPEEETPLLVCAPGQLRRPAPSPPGLRCRWTATRDEDLAFVAALMRQGFELRGAISAADTEGLRAGQEAGVRYAVAELEGLPAASACSAPLGEVTEISAVSTLPTLRRRGVAAGLVAFVMDEHFAGGGRVAWGCTPDPAGLAVLAALGFADAALRVSFREP